MLAGLTCGTCTGCLVTDPVQFSAEADIPPMIVDAPGTVTPIASVIWINKAEQSMWPMSVKVRELNVAQDLKYHWRLVNKDDPMPAFQVQPLPPQGDAVLRDLTFDVQSDSLRDSECARLDLAVSGSFFNRTSPPTYFDVTKGEDDSDLALASWWIWEGEGQTKTLPDDKARIASSCPTQEGLLPTPMPMTMSTTP